jgi:ferric-dicitrate binding protein FerR (iron transport regulator)
MPAGGVLSLTDACFMNGKTYYRFLLERYMHGNATEAEVADLMQELEKGDNREGWEEMIQAMIRESDADPEYDRLRWQPLVESIMASRSGKPKPGRVINFRRRWMIAAGIVLFIAAGAFYYSGQRPDKSTLNNIIVPAEQMNDIAPGGDKAILTLADGSTIILDSNANGAISSQGQVKIINLQGQLTYAGKNAKQEEVMYNTITTPRGGQYQILLADGTRVWLNAASSLRFPNAFAGTERRVELTGEGYFEVAHHAGQPFLVESRKGIVEVLGTHFNINAYDDEATVNTTLLEGSIRVKSGTGSVTLKPGQQSSVGNDGSIQINNQVDEDVVIAWKNGNFQFGEAMNIEMIMRQLARWYNLEVEYRTKLTGHIGGSIPRNENVSKVLDMMEMTGAVKFEIHGRKVTVLPK